MNTDSASRFLYRLIRKTLDVLTRLIRKILNAFNRLRINYDCPDFRTLLCVSAGFSNTYWTKSWKTELLARLVDADDGLFVDVGANIGQTLLDLLVVRPMARYVGFEPNVSCVYYLRELIRVNSFNNCLIVPVALTDETRCLPLYRSKTSLADECATIISDLRPDRLFDADFVPCFKFDEIRASLSLDDIDFVKIDVEGAELETLTGMRKSVQEFRPLILCEVLFADSKADLIRHKVRNDRLMQFLGDLNYRALQLVKSADGAHVLDAKTIQEFPSAHWTQENKDLCDYLFIPVEEEVDVLNALLPKK